MKKIMLFNTLYFPYIVGGAEKSTQILAETLINKGFDVTVVSTGKKDEEKNINGVKVYYINIPNIFWRYEADKQGSLKRIIWRFIDFYNPFTEKKIKRIISKEKPDICHTNNIGGFSVSLWNLIKKMDIPIIHTIRDYYLLCANSKMFKTTKVCEKQCLECMIYTYNKKLISKNVDAVIGISKFILSKHLDYNYFENAKIKSVIYNSVPKQSTETKMKTNFNKIKLGFIGQLSPSKGIEFLLKNFIKLNKVKNNLELHVYGKGRTVDYENYLREKYKSDSIKFHTFKDTSEIYSEIDIVIIPSIWHEPFSRVLIESYSYNIPVLATNRGGIPENVIEGQTGFVFDPDIEGDFEKKLEKTIDFFLKNKFKFDNTKNFDINYIAEKYIDIYNKIIK